VEPHLSRLPVPRLLVLAALAAAPGCDKGAADNARRMTGHVLTDMQSGVALDLPLNWAGRYRMTDTLTGKDAGIERELTLRYVRSDSTIVPEPLLVIKVVSAAAWNALPPDSASARYGAVVASDAARTVAVRPAGGNPLTPGTADALGYDSLMMIVIQRPMRASLRPEPAKR
jgi:hypothetical protein